VTPPAPSARASDAAVVPDAPPAGEAKPATPAAEAKPVSPQEPKAAAEAKPSAPQEPKASAEAKPEAKPTAAREKLADKDVARDAWRRNLPDVSSEPGKAAMLIPIKGSIEGSTYHVSAKPKSVLVVLPKGDSMITMPFYSVKRDGFRQLWIKKEDESGTTLRIVLGEASDPQVEIRDDFVRVTIRRPAGAPATDPGAPVAP
jgi:hypothetical protein